MSIANQRHGIRGVRAVVLVLLAFCSFALWAAPANPPPGLFAAAAAPAHPTLPAQAIAGRQSFVRVNFGMLRSGRLYLDLMEGAAFEAVRDQVMEYSNGSSAWVGHVNGSAGGRVVLARSGNALAGVFHFDGHLYKLQYLGDGVHVVSEVGTGDPNPEMDPIPVADATATAAAGDVVALGDSGAVVDVMAVYTPASRTRYGGVDGVNALIALAVSETNQAYVNSQVATSLNLVHTAEVSYTESGDMGTDLNRITSKTDGYMDEVHALRDTYHADTVTLIEESSQYCGIAWLMTTLTAAFESNAFSVVASNCATGYYSFGHELGHNMGSSHDHLNASTALYVYSYGWQDPESLFRTVMAYNCPAGCTRVQHFSNPTVLYGGKVTGEVNYADNALSLNTTASTVANWRASAPAAPPAAPTNLTATATSHTDVTLAWTDNASDEDGFRLYRSADGVSFSLIATLAANTTTFGDSGLSAETPYWYRVLAFNGAGDSIAAEASVTTQAAPTFVDQLAQGETPVSGTVTGTYADTWVADGVSETVTEVSSGGKPSKRSSLLEHQWSFNVVPGSAVALNARVTTDAANGESFAFAYSVNGGAFVPMFTISAASSADQQFLLPAGTGGTVTVRVQDTQRVAGTVTGYSLAVDYLAIRSELVSTGLPAAPTGLTATAGSATTIDLAWSDNADNEFGFEIERSSDAGATWSLVASVPANTAAYQDSGLAGETTYAYRVSAYNGDGSSGYSNTASATTQAAAAIDLTVSAGKVRGQPVAELSWSGNTAQVEVLRNGTAITTVSGSSYTDSSVVKGSSYSYQVCESASRCSAAVSITF